ncbi:MAG: heparinase II/III family protein, partial [Kiritimatiellales bacterium]
SGLYALLLTSRFFNEFLQTQSSIKTQADAAMLDFVSTMVHPDGGMLEQSLNYNEGDADRMEELLGIFGTNSRSWSGLMRTDIDSFWRMVWALRGPTFSPPQIGNEPSDITPEVWTNTVVKSKWISSQTNNNPATGPLEKQINDCYAGTGTAPAFTSVAFPYAGYYVQRSGWTLADRALFFMGGRPQRGHYMCDKNAVQLSAFGRDLLVAAGPPNYYPDTAPTVADAYLSEQSSRKVNTILVDGNNQNKTNKLIVLAQQVYTNTINAIWHSTEYFDAVEGLHEQGYGSETNVTHHRQSFFVKEAGLWVLIDNLLSSDADSHSYRQVWHFQPYKTNDGTKVYGFKEAEVVIDQTNHCIYTADNDTTNTPNVWLYSFGQNVTYEKYYGSTNPCYGWYARSIGDCIPAVDVHAVFSGSSNLQLVTLIRPIQGLASGITGLSDLSSGITNGFDCVTGSSASLSVRSTLQSNATLTASGISAQAKILLVTPAGGTKRGIVMKASTFSAGAVNAVGLAGRSFEFKVESNGVVMAKNILVPRGFEWSGNSGAMVPDYGNGSNDWYNISP